VSSQNISIDYPDKVCVNEEFDIEIKSNYTKIYDIKIDILDENKRLVKIWDGKKWSSTMYYIIDGFESDGKYKLKAESSGNGEIFIKFRNEDVITFSGYNIEITNDCSSLRKKEENNKYEMDYTSHIEEKIKIFPEHNYTAKKMDAIILTPQTIKTDDDLMKLDKGYAKYLIVLFSALLAFLYFKKIKKNKNEFH
jgi:hypothetical protein